MKLRLLWIGIVALAMASCEAHEKGRAVVSYDREPPEFILSVTLDTTGSYEKLMFGPDAKAYRHFVGLKDSFHRERAGSEDLIMLSQITGTGVDPLVWSGYPRTFQRAFSNAYEFNTFLKDRASPHGSRVFDSMADVLDSVLARHDAHPGTQSACFFYTDMDDNVGNIERSRARLLSSLRAYAKKGGIVAILWVDRKYEAEWWTNLRNCGFTPAQPPLIGPSHFIVEAKINADPPVLSFE